MNLQLANYELWLKASGASPSTIRLRLFYLRTIATMYSPQELHTLTTEQLIAFVSRDGWSPETRRCVRAVLKSFFRYAIDAELVERDPTRKLPPVRVPVGKPRPTPESTFAQALLRANRRDRLMLLLAGYAGLRRSEVASVHTDHVVAGELRVKGKGGTVRLIPLHPRILDALREVPSGWLFPGKSGSHLTPGYVGQLLAELLGPGWSAHSLRHRFASMAYLSDRDLLAVQSLLGHSSPTTTQRYTMVPQDAKRAAVFAIA